MSKNECSEEKTPAKTSALELKLDPDQFGIYVQRADDKSIIKLLSQLGRLDTTNSKLVPHLLNLMTHKTANVRTAAAHNLGKFGEIKLLPDIEQILETEQNTEVRRELISTVGRMRSRETVPLLTKLLQDFDPKAVMQAIRGLLVFKKDPQVIQTLVPLLNHPNEQIQRILTPIFANGPVAKNTKREDNTAAEYLTNTVVLGNVLDILKNVADEEIHLTFTSPPYYNARDYSIYESYDEYLRFLREVFEAVHRVTHEGRFLIINTSPVILPRFSRAHASRRYPIPFDIHSFMDQIGWEYIDDIIWLKPEASVKNRNGGFQQHRKPLGYKPNNVTEMLMVYRKKTDRLIDWNMKLYDKSTIEQSLVPDGFETSNVWRIDPKTDKVHSAVFPIDLCHRIISYYSFKGDVVFDPFAGSGTLGKAAMGLDRNFFLTEVNSTYFKHMKSSTAFNENIFSEVGHKRVRFLDIQEFAALRKTDNANRSELRAT